LTAATVLHAIERSIDEDGPLAGKKKQTGNPPAGKRKARAAAGSSRGAKKPPLKKRDAAPAAPNADVSVPVAGPAPAAKPGTPSPPAKDTRNLLEKMIEEDDGKEVDEPVDPEATARGDSPMTLVGHLGEMRSRLLVVLVAVLVMMLVAFAFSDYLMAIIARPFTATGQKLNLFTIFEGFTLRLKGSLFASALICLPLIIYQVWKYIEPAVNRNDRMMMRLTLFSAIFLFYAGVVFTYFFLPLAIGALMAFAPPDMLITNNATEYFNFFLMSSLILGAVFELPIVMLLLTKMGIVSPHFLTSKRKYAIIIIWIIAALASPGPDPLSQALLALPLMLLYELSIVISKLIVRRKKKKELAERM